ncbi:hypothetical protein [Woodsholea maritima]|uniref:hypothetical protein n=1 Tax=Woodsholea maritima TaxID=240237 RepID=UPI00036BB73D|nr:hypothetical protein [Woodsholea maritima]
MSQSSSPQQSSQKKTTLTGAMTWIGAFAGFLWGDTAGDADPEIGFWAGALAGALLGAATGWIGALTLRVVFHVAFLALALLLIAGRVLWFFNNMGA